MTPAREDAATSVPPARPAAARSATQDWVRALEATARIARDPARTLPVVIAEGAQRFGDAPAILSDERSYSHVQLAARCQRYARWGLQRGLARGEVVGLLMENSPEYLAVWVGLTRLGVVVSLLNIHLRGAALAHAVGLVRPAHVIVGASLWSELAPFLREQAGGARLWCADDGWAPSIAAAAPAGADELLEPLLAALDDRALTEAECPLPTTADRALYIYTSGTTGLPKAALVSHARVMQWSHWFAAMVEITPADRTYNCLPMYHSVGGIVAVGAALVAGGSVVVRRRFSASRFWDDIVRWDCTVFQYIGELCRILVMEPPHPAERAHRLRIACGNGLAGDIWERFRERFALPRILEFYAATEANFSLYNCEGRVGSLGRIPAFLAPRFPIALVRFDVAAGVPLRDGAGRCIRCDVDEPGEAISQVSADAGPASRRFEGYTDAAATQSKILRDVFEPGDAWYRSGDLMRRDGAGFYYFVDRVGDTFRWKGENVSTTEVAGALCACPGVDEALVYGVAVSGNDGRAGMAALSVGADFDLGRLWRHAQDALPRYARPLFLRLLSQVDRTGTFKPTKHDLARAGFDPAAVGGDPLYASDGEAQAYVALDAAAHARIEGGAWRFY
jgi:fatty-acyl-CoA synthase